MTRKGISNHTRRRMETGYVYIIFWKYSQGILNRCWQRRMKKDEEGYLQIKNRLDWYHLQKQDKLYHRNDTEICAPNNEGGVLRGKTQTDPTICKRSLGQNGASPRDRRNNEIFGGTYSYMERGHLSARYWMRDNCEELTAPSANRTGKRSHARPGDAGNTCELWDTPIFPGNARR